MRVAGVLGTVAIGCALVGLAGYFLSVCHALVALRRDVRRSWAAIATLLEERHGELPGLVRTCEGYLRRERAVFDRLREARAALAGARTRSERAGAEEVLTRALDAFFTVAESYPDLGANLSFQRLRTRIGEIENRILDWRQFHNDAVHTFNIRIEQMPEKLVADLLSWQPVEPFAADDEGEEDVEIRLAA